MSRKKKITLTAIMVLLLMLLCGGLYVYGMYNSTQSGNLNTDNLNINKNLSEDVVNIAVFGIDGRADAEVEGDRSDTIMIATIDMKNNSIKLTSIMRDTFVQINESNGTTSYQKINAAYNLGGAEQAIKTINENFDLNISEYVTVNFDCLMDLVDAVGGVTVNVQNEDVLYWTNQYLQDSNFYGSRNDPDLTTTGEQTLTGAQALAYARNRYSDSDYGRTQRQREIVGAIFDKVKNIDVLTALNLVNKLYPYVKTSLDMGEMSNYAKTILSTQDLTYTDFRVPTDEFGLGGYLDGSWYLFPNTLVDNARVLHEFLYGSDSAFTPSEQLQTISDKIATYANSSTDQSTGGSTNDSSGSTSDTSSGSSSDYSSDYGYYDNSSSGYDSGSSYSGESSYQPDSSPSYDSGSSDSSAGSSDSGSSDSSAAADSGSADSGSDTSSAQ